MKAHAYHARTRRAIRLQRMFKALVLTLLVVAILIAWSAVPEPDLMDAGYYR